MNYRKVIAILLVALLTMSCIQGGIASEKWNEYALNEIGVSISFPSEFDVFTRNMPSNSQVLLDYGMTAEEVNINLITNNTFLDAYSIVENYEIVVTMIGSSIYDFNVCDDDALNFLASICIEGFKENGIIVDKFDIYRNAPITFIRMWERSANDPEIYGLQYYTVYNYQAINITMTSYDGEILTDDEQLMLDIVDSAVFGESNNASLEYDIPTDTADFEYEILSDGTAKIVGYTGMQASISIPESINGYRITSIGKLKKNSAVTTICIPASVESIEGNPFVDFNGLQEISVNEKNTSFTTEAGVLYSYDKKKLVCYPCRLVSKTFVVPLETEIIGERAFYNCDNLVYIEISEGVEAIEFDAFACADGITDIHFPKTLKSVDGNPFAYCYSLYSISVDPLNPYFYAQDGVLFNRAEKKLQAFPYNKSIENYAIPEGIISIGESAFNNHAGCAAITFPKSLRKIGSWAFNRCSGFSFPEMMGQITQIDEFAFESCDTVESITIHNNAKIGKSAFGGCNGLISASIEEGVTEISDYTFFSCESLQNVELPSTLRSIGEHAFRMCESLKSLTIPMTVNYIGECAFDDCPELVIRVEEGSYAAQYCQINHLKYEFYNASNECVDRSSYLDPESGTSFLLPDGWVQREFSEEREFIDATFVPKNGDYSYIIYACEDYWMAIEEEKRLELERMGYYRKDTDNSLLSPDYLAEIYSIESEGIHVVNLSNQDFYKADIVSNQELSIPIKTTVFICVRNGYMYSFQFVGTNDSTLNEMLTSIVW